MTTKNEDIKVADTIGSMFDAIINDDQEAATHAFNLAMSEKLTGHLDTMKIDIASQLYNN